MMDVLAAQYGWSFASIRQLTYFQLDHFKRAIEDRVYNDRRILFDLFRNAQHGDSVACEQFLMALEPERKTQRDQREEEYAPIPEGIVYQR